MALARVAMNLKQVESNCCEALGMWERQLVLSGSVINVWMCQDPWKPAADVQPSSPAFSLKVKRWGCDRWLGESL